MVWEQVKNFFKPTPVKTLVTAMLVLAYIALTFYQGFYFSSALHSVEHLYYTEFEAHFLQYPISQFCMTAELMREWHFDALESVKPTIQTRLQHTEFLQAVRTTFYPGSHYIEFYPRPPAELIYRFPALLSPGDLSEFDPYSAEFVFATVLMVAYFYVITCTAEALLKSRLRSNGSKLTKRRRR